MKILIITFALVTVLSPLGLKADTLKVAAKFLSADALNGRAAGSQGNLKAREWLVAKLKELKVGPAGDEGSYLQAYRGGKNILGIIRPENSQSNELPRVLIGAHYDHVSHCKRLKQARSKVCNGAADNAAAVAVILAAIEHLKGQIDAPVAIAFWDGEEKGLKGSMAFARSPSFDPSGLNLYINLDIIGLNLLRGFENNTFMIGAETGGTSLVADAQVAAQDESVNYHQISYGFGHYRSDMTSFVLKGHKIPFVFFTDGDGKVYHSSADEFENLNMDKMRSISRVIARLAKLNTQTDKKSYAYSSPRIHLQNKHGIGLIVGPFLGLRNGMVLPLYPDALSLQKVISSLLLLEKENGFSPRVMKLLKKKEQRLKNISAQGPLMFGTSEAISTAMAAQSLLKLSRKLHFIP